MYSFKFPGAACEVTGVLQGLTEGKHGLHILEYGNISQGLNSDDHFVYVITCIFLWLGMDQDQILESSWDKMSQVHSFV